MQILGCKEKSAIKNGQTDIYPAWKSLLSAWLSKNGCEVYLATPFIDTKRMIDICNIVIENKSTANIKAFFVRNKCYYDKTVTEIVKDASEAIIASAEKEDKEKISKLIKNNISDKIVNPKFPKNFHAKFIGCVHSFEARVLVTSANFTDQHFDYENLETVVCHEMDALDFVKRIITPLNAISA